MLNMQDKGVHNCVSVFGTQSLKHNTARKMLAYKAQGIQKVFILFDGDNAGREAAKEIAPLLEEQNFLTQIIVMPEGLDPGSASAEYINTIKEIIK
jgi:DNA primase